jgi:hypothetical protein
MSDPSRDFELNDLAEYLSRSSRLNAAEARRVIDEVLHFLDELPEEFVRRRHWALQTQGLSNNEIFGRLSDELRERRFRAPAYTLRQLRRIVYG